MVQGVLSRAWHRLWTLSCCSWCLAKGEMVKARQAALSTGCLSWGGGKLIPGEKAGHIRVRKTQMLNVAVLSPASQSPVRYGRCRTIILSLLPRRACTIEKSLKNGRPSSTDRPCENGPALMYATFPQANCMLTKRLPL